MVLREKTRTKEGKTHRYWSVGENRRISGKKDEFGMSRLSSNRKGISCLNMLKALTCHHLGNVFAANRHLRIWRGRAFPSSTMASSRALERGNEKKMDTHSSLRENTTHGLQIKHFLSFVKSVLLILDWLRNGYGCKSRVHDHEKYHPDGVLCYHI